jgi:hypothetical protein
LLAGFKNTSKQFVAAIPDTAQKNNHLSEKKEKNLQPFVIGFNDTNNLFVAGQIF